MSQLLPIALGVAARGGSPISRALASPGFAHHGSLRDQTEDADGGMLTVTDVTSSSVSFCWSPTGVVKGGFVLQHRRRSGNVVALHVEDGALSRKRNYVDNPTFDGREEEDRGEWINLASVPGDSGDVDMGAPLM